LLPPIKSGAKAIQKCHANPRVVVEPVSYNNERDWGDRILWRLRSKPTTGTLKRDKSMKPLAKKQ
jgi:hypothetical protein